MPINAIPLTKPEASRFQVSVRLKQPKGTKQTKKALQGYVLAWLDGQDTPGVTVSLVIWEGTHKRHVEPQDDERGQRLKDLIRRALQRGKLPLRKVRPGR